MVPSVVIYVHIYIYMYKTEVCDLVGLFILNELTSKFGKNNMGL